jgi:hypothetical protein
VNRFANEILRWAAVLVLVAAGQFVFLGVGFQALLHGGGLFFFGLVLFCSAPFFCIAYYCARRRYEGVVTVIAFFASMALLGVLVVALGRWLGLFQFIDRHVPDQPLWIVVGSWTVLILCLVGACEAAQWFSNFCTRMTVKYLGEEGAAKAGET